MNDVEKALNKDALKHLHSLVELIHNSTLSRFFSLDHVKDRVFQVSGNDPFYEDNLATLIDDLGGFVITEKPV